MINLRSIFLNFAAVKKLKKRRREFEKFIKSYRIRIKI